MAAKQFVVLSGLGLTAFKEYVDAITEIHSYFADCIPTGTLLPWQPQYDSGYTCIEFANRYFNPFVDCTQYNEVPISHDVDPYNVIKNSITDGKHTEDNVVMYYDRLRVVNTSYVILVPTSQYRILRHS